MCVCGTHTQQAHLLSLLAFACICCWWCHSFHSAHWGPESLSSLHLSTTPRVCRSLSIVMLIFEELLLLRTQLDRSHTHTQHTHVHTCTCRRAHSRRLPRSCCVGGGLSWALSGGWEVTRLRAEGRPCWAPSEAAAQRGGRSGCVGGQSAVNAARKKVLPSPNFFKRGRKHAKFTCLSLSNFQSTLNLFSSPCFPRTFQRIEETFSQ